MVSFSMFKIMLLAAVPATAEADRISASELTAPHVDERRRKIANDPACPRQQPSSGSNCHSGHLDKTCSYGSEQCFGREFYSINAQCLGGRWALVSTEACRSAPIFTKVGDGFCRDTRGGQGQFRVITTRARFQCENECSNDTKCLGYEYQHNGRCELHRTPLSNRVKQSRDAVCYQKVMSGRRRVVVQDKQAELARVLDFIENLMRESPESQELQEVLESFALLQDGWEVQEVLESLALLNLEGAGAATLDNQEPPVSFDPLELDSQIEADSTPTQEPTAMFEPSLDGEPMDEDLEALIESEFDLEILGYEPAADRRRTIANDPLCPRQQPSSGSACHSGHLDKTCSYGNESCFGRNFYAIDARCLGGRWALVPTEACRGAPIAPTFTKLGDGFCRTSNGGNGKFRLVKVSNRSQCQGECQKRSDCRGYEFSKPKSGPRCELHTTMVVSVRRSRNGGVSCWSKNGAGFRRFSMESFEEAVEAPTPVDSEE